MAPEVVHTHTNDCGRNILPMDAVSDLFCGFFFWSSRQPTNCLSGFCEHLVLYSSQDCGVKLKDQVRWFSSLARLLVLELCHVPNVGQAKAKRSQNCTNIYQLITITITSLAGYV